MSTGSTITLEEAEDYLYNNVAIQTVAEHRWYTKRLVVFWDEGDGGFWGFYYLDPLSELQDGQDRFESDPVAVFPVTPKETVVTVYEPGAVTH